MLIKNAKFVLLVIATSVALLSGCVVVDDDYSGYSYTYTDGYTYGYPAGYSYNTYYYGDYYFGPYYEYRRHYRPLPVIAPVHRPPRFDHGPGHRPRPGDGFRPGHRPRPGNGFRPGHRPRPGNGFQPGHRPRPGNGGGARIPRTPARARLL